MRVLTAFTQGKGVSPNLDRLVATDAWVAVIDGVTPKSDEMAGAIAATARLVDDMVVAIENADPGLDPFDLVDTLTDITATHQGRHRPSAAGAVFSLAARRVVVVTDTWVAVDGSAQFYGHRYEEHVTGIRRALTDRELAAGRSVDDLRRDDPGRVAIGDLLVRESGLMNVDGQGDYFYAAWNGLPIPRHLLTSVEVPLDARELILATDGYPVLAPTWEETELALQRELADDPLRIGPYGGPKALAPGADSFDDRSFVLVEL
ncbi:hypothetical protein GON03_00865 [Nocardioides sp. MAH-18]|uniref:PPM-type phosphatase domain-containing protein n=1 Tax=Nocardioides agri TaxID=2682843 RepID=A0A6L6XLT6_9ACTN|nr:MULTISPECIES: hypothetical protein [unclassified Nocardioides]MBA2956568.1 hypothetical protein [Nocardioides sp. CGMCC 1.13656]MVQ47713.1 hypothetical protein [Nocardioides sp. MAH-18]